MAGAVPARSVEGRQSVLIHGGSGGVGHFAIQFAKAKGARVLTTVSTANVAFARSLGTDVVIDYKTHRFEDHASDLDMVFDLIDGEIACGCLILPAASSFVRS
jgi:NADPH:quinone reductase-like Zn-dependent oxidoreductase